MASSGRFEIDSEPTRNEIERKYCSIVIHDFWFERKHDKSPNIMYVNFYIIYLFSKRISVTVFTKKEKI